MIWNTRWRVSLAALVTFPCLAWAGDPLPADDGLNAVLWAQTSVEAKANALGAFALAKLRLDQALADPGWASAAAEQTGTYKDLPPAVVLEVDDTILDNSAYQAWTVTARTRFSAKTWARYIEARRDAVVPGALDFTTYAASKGVTVFYVSNRTGEEKPATVEEMKAFGFPMGGAGDTFLALKERPDWMSAKGTRRAFIAKTHRILLLIGDQLGDFTDDYKGGVAERQTVFEKNRDHWGHDWIMLANPVYGSFEAATYNGDGSIDPGDKRAHKVKALNAWDGQ